MTLNQKSLVPTLQDESSDVDDLEAHPDDATTLVLGAGSGKDVAALEDLEDGSDHEFLDMCCVDLYNLL